MAKYQHWYIRGWVYEDVLGRNGAVTRKLTYRGEYYRPYCSRSGFLRRKVLFTALLIVIYAVYVGYSFCGSAGGRVFYAGAGSILAIIPLMFQGMGVASLWAAPEQMPFRNYYAGVLRTKVASGVTAGLLAASGAGEAAFMLLHREREAIRWADEWCWLCGCMICAAASFVIFYMLHTLHFDILPGEIDTTTRRQRLK